MREEDVSTFDIEEDRKREGIAFPLYCFYNAVYVIFLIEKQFEGQQFKGFILFFNRSMDISVFQTKKVGLSSMGHRLFISTTRRNNSIILLSVKIVRS